MVTSLLLLFSHLIYGQFHQYLLQSREYSFCSYADIILSYLVCPYV